MLQDDFEHEEIIAETKWDNAADFIDIDKVIDLPNSPNAFIVNSKGANVTMQEAYYLPVSPADSQVIKVSQKVMREKKYRVLSEQSAILRQQIVLVKTKQKCYATKVVHL